MEQVEGKIKRDGEDNTVKVKGDWEEREMGRDRERGD